MGNWVQTSVRIDQGLYKKLKKMAKAERRSYSSLIEVLLRKGLEKPVSFEKDKSVTEAIERMLDR